MNATGNATEPELQDNSQSISTALDWFTFGFIWLLFLLCIIGNLLNVKVLSARTKKGWLLVELLLGIVSVSDMVAMTLVAVCVSRVRSASSWDHFSRPQRERKDARRNTFIVACTTGLLMACALVPSYELAAQQLVYENNVLVPMKDHSRHRDLFRRWQRVHLTVPLIVAPVMFVVMGCFSLALCVLTQRHSTGSLRFRQNFAQPSGETVNPVNNIPARMAAGSACLYFFTQAPVYFFNLFTYPWFVHGLPSDKHWRNGLENLITNLAMMNYSCDFLVYMGSSRQFRQEIQKLTDWCRQRPLRATNGDMPLLPREMRARYASCPSQSNTDSLLQGSLREPFG